MIKRAGTSIAAGAQILAGGSQIMEGVGQIKLGNLNLEIDALTQQLAQITGQMTDKQSELSFYQNEESQIGTILKEILDSDSSTSQSLFEIINTFGATSAAIAGSVGQTSTSV